MGNDTIKIIGFEKDLVLWAAENKHDAVAMMTTWMGRTNEVAEKDYNGIVGPEGTLPRRGAFDPSPLNTVLDLRLKTGLMNPPAPPLNKYFDDTFYREASS